jgi:hypothetical protein
MKKLRFVQYLTYFTIIFILFIVLPGAAYAVNSHSEEHGNQNQNMQEESMNSSSRVNETNNTGEEGISEADSGRLEGNPDVKNQNRVFEYKQERQKIKEELELQREDYHKAKKDFLKVKNQIHAGKLNPDSYEVLNATKLYLNSSISYMIAHLSNVKSNMEYANCNGTEKIVADIDEKIKLLETKKAEVANASSQKELAATVRSLRETWVEAQRLSLAGSGQIVSEKVGEYLEKSKVLSDILNARIENLNETGADVSDLKIKFVSYKSYLTSAQSEKKDADAVYEDQNATREKLEEANNYLLQSISDINKANKLLKDIFIELKKYENQKNNESEVESSLKTELKIVKYVNYTKNN